MALVQDPSHIRLDVHLTLRVHMFTQDLFELRTLPFGAALEQWQEGSRRGRYMVNRYLQYRGFLLLQCTGTVGGQLFSILFFPSPHHCTIISCVRGVVTLWGRSQCVTNTVGYDSD